MFFQDLNACYPAASVTCRQKIIQEKQTHTDSAYRPKCTIHI